MMGVALDHSQRLMAKNLPDGGKNNPGLDKVGKRRAVQRLADKLLGVKPSSLLDQ
jgi:hypothetical protein